MRRWITGVSVLLLAAVVGRALVAPAPVETPTLPVHAVQQGVRLPDRAVGTEGAATADAAWTARAETVAAACSVDIRTACSAAGCASVARTPDLDRVAGWVSLGWSSPGLVAVTLLGDLGVLPRSALPCQSAIADLGTELHGGFRIADGPEGTWVTCVRNLTGDAGGDALCAEAAAHLDLTWGVPDPSRHL